MTLIYKHPFERLGIFLKEYKSRLAQALTAIEVIENNDADSESLVEAIDQFTEDRPE